MGDLPPYVEAKAYLPVRAVVRGPPSTASPSAGAVTGST